MIDAALAAAIAAPVAPAGEPAPAEGFGDLLSQVLGVAAQLSTAGAQEAAEAPDPMDALLAAQAAATAATAPAAAAQVPAPGKAGRDSGDQTVTEHTGKAASSAWHASPAGRAHASAQSAVVLAAAAQAALEAARQGANQGATQGATQGAGDVAETVTAAAPVLAIHAAGQAPLEAISDGDAPAAAEALFVPAEAAETAMGASGAQADTAVADTAVADTAVADAAQADVTQAASRTASGTPRAVVADSAIGRADVTAGDAAPAAKPAAPAPARAGQRVEAPAAPVGVDGGAPRAADQAGQAAEVRPAGPPAELFASGALRRVMEAVEAAEHRPPPNTMAVEIPGEGAEGALRLMVSVRGSVVEITAQGDRVLPPGWARPLAEALAERGMSLEGFSGQDGAGRQDGAAEGRDGQAARDERAARRAGVLTAAPRTVQMSSTGHDGALRL